MRAKKAILALLVVILLSPAYAYNVAEKEQLIRINRQIRNDYGNDWIYGIYQYPQLNITYKFYWYPRPLSRILSQRIGDCSDRAELSFQLYQLKGIPVRKVHGYSDGAKHDYIEIQKDGNWTSFENNTKIGLGFW